MGVLGRIGAAVAIGVMGFGHAVAPSPPPGQWQAGQGWAVESIGEVMTGTATSRSPSSVVAAVALAAPGDAWFLQGEVKGTAGRVVNVAASEATSAPLRLDGTWQRFGVSGRISAGILPVRLQADGEWAPSDRVEVRGLGVDASGPTATAVVPGTRIITAGGEPFVARGFNYTSHAIGHHYVTHSTFENPAACQQDARLLGGSGVTTLRALIQDVAIVQPDQHRACLDAFWANGIGIDWLEQGPTDLSTVVDDPLWVEAWKAKIDQSAALVADHPATLLWVLGNEVEIQSPESAAAWYGAKQGRRGILDELAEHLHAIDPHHLVGTSLAGIPLNRLRNSNVPLLDFWGLHFYGGPANVPYADPATGEPGHVSESVSAADPRPKIITEWGSDRLRCVRGVDSEIHEDVSDVLGTTPRWRTWTCAEGSGDDAAAHAAQGAWNSGLWDQMEFVLATPDNPDGAFGGGLFFMSTDWWWFSTGVFSPGTPATHETTGTAWGGTFDGVFNPEFHGVMYAQYPDQAEPRATTIALDLLADRWAKQPLRLQDVRVDVVSSPTGACTATVRWKTNRPATSELQAGADRATPELITDDTTFAQVAYDPQLRKRHELDTQLSRLGPTRLVARSWSQSGRHATHPPIVVPACQEP